jgi:hypothetical protein
VKRLHTLALFCIDPHTLRSFLIGLMVVGFPASALNPSSKLFEQSFESLSGIQQVGGVCTVGGVACTSSVLIAGASGNAIEFKKTGFPTLSFPVSSGGNANINPEKGTVIFNYKPTFGLPDGDWGTSTPLPKTLFRLYDSNSSIANYETLGIGTYYDSATLKNYVYFRYDTTGSCTAGWGGTAPCYHNIGSTAEEPNVIMAWNPNIQHSIVATWDFSSTAAHKFIALSIDGRKGWYQELNTPISLAGFSPSIFYVGSKNGNNSAQGTIDNLEIYNEVAFDPADPVGSYKGRTHNDGVWQPYETINDSTDAPLARNISGQSFIFYSSYAFEPIYEGSVPAGATDPANITVHVTKNQRETAFFNIYAGTNDLGTVTTTVSTMSSGANSINQSKIKIRTVKNWWQAGDQVQRNLFMPAYTPELLVYDDTVNLHCTGSLAGHPCRGGLFPSDPASTSTTTQVKANTSRQFAITLDIPANQAAGTYAGTITVSTTNAGYKTLPIDVVVHNVALPEIDKVVSLYHGSQFADNTVDNYVTQSQFSQQVQNMREHGVNGMLFGGQAWNFFDASIYPSLSVSGGVQLFGAYPYFTNHLPLTQGEKDQAVYLVDGLAQNGFIPYLYGEDEPDSHGTVPKHLAESKAIHAACASVSSQSVCGKVVVAITKQWADNLNRSSFFPYTDSTGVTYTFAQGKLDLPNIAVESADTTTANYFVALLSGNQSVRAANPELYYWQMYREDPRINRFYTGYHLWLTDLDGVMPYVYQRVEGDPYNDFDVGLANERDLNTAYPSLEGGIDTIEWEAFRAGLDDYRLLQLWKALYGQINAQSPGKAAARKSTVDALLVKYRNRQAFATVDRATFASDRQLLIAEVEAMSSDMTDTDGDGVLNLNDNCPSAVNTAQTDVNANNIGDTCEHGLTAAYFNIDPEQSAYDITLVDPPVLRRIDLTIDFNWILVSPASGINSDYFGVRWTGRLVPPVTGTYEFCTSSDDGINLWIDNDLLIGKWYPQDGSQQWCASTTLTANQSVPFKLEFFDILEEAFVHLTWSYPGQAEQAIPSARVYAE